MLTTISRGVPSAFIELAIHNKETQIIKQTSRKLQKYYYKQRNNKRIKTNIKQLQYDTY